MPSSSAQGLHSLLPLLASTGTAIQLIVLAALLLASVICWGVILQKFRVFRRARRDSQRFLDAFYSGNDLMFVVTAARRFASSPLARVFLTVHQQFEALVSGYESVADHTTTSSREQLAHLLHRAQAEEILQLESGLPFLATTAGVAPFVGLLGTVWGIMQSFHAIGLRGGATLAVVGPGISEALVATAAGLAAAIPAVVAYNHYLHRLRRIESELEGFTAELVLLLENYLAPQASQQSRRTPLQRSQGV